MKFPLPSGECFGYCDFENPAHKSRATWCCPNCGRDYSLEYLFYYEATHPELDKVLDIKE